MIQLSYNARSLVVRWSSSIMAGLGIALVVMILFILFGFVDGMRRTVQSMAETSPTLWREFASPNAATQSNRPSFE